MSGKTVTIIGGTGQTGQWVVKGALQRSHRVQLLARDPVKVERILKELFGESEGEEEMKKVKVVKGGIKDEAALEEVVTGADTVISCLGMTKASPGWVVEPGVKLVLAALRKVGGRGKLVSLSAMGIRESGLQTKKSSMIMGPLTYHVIIPYMLKDCFADMEASELVLEAERPDGLVTTVLRAPVLKDGKSYRLDYTDKSQQNYIYAEATMVTGIKSWRLDRQDVAAGLLDCVDSQDIDNKTITLLQK